MDKRYEEMVYMATRRAMSMGLSVEATGQYVKCYIDAWPDYVKMLNASSDAMDTMQKQAQASVRRLGLTVSED